MQISCCHHVVILLYTKEIVLTKVTRFAKILLNRFSRLSLHCEILGSHGGEYEDDAASIIMVIALMMEEASTSETSVNFYQTTRRNNPEDSHLLSAH
jgi:hypothetical protein